MILGGKHHTAGETTTLDDLFRRAGVRHPDAVALADPPNRAGFTDGAPRRLTFAQADRAISALAARLRDLGLQTDMVVAFQLPNTVESVITLLGILRAGMIAVPLPLLWRRQEMVSALRMVGAKAIVSCARIKSTAQSTSLADLAAQVAVELFPIRFICGFGSALPDGVVPLDDIFVPAHPEFVQPPARPGNAAAHVAIVTFDVGGDGMHAMARNHIELIAGGVGPYLECGSPPDSPTVSTVPLNSFAGVALTVMPWLLGGGTLNLHHAFDPETFAAQCRGQDDGTVVLPGPALAALDDADRLGRPSNIIALWRSPERLTNSPAWHGTAKLVDVASFGEAGLLASARGPDGLALPIPYGNIGAPRAAATVPMLEAQRSTAGTLMLRGAMVPAGAFPPGAEELHPAVDRIGFVDTGYVCRIERDSQMLTIDGAPAAVTSVGFYRFRQNQLDGLVASINPHATIVAVPSALLDARLGGSTSDYPAMAAQLQASGANPLIVEAFRPRRNAA